MYMYSITESSSRWLLSLIDFSKYKKGYISAKFKYIKLKFDVIISESHSQHIDGA